MEDLRPMTSSLGQLSRPDGTVTFSQGDTEVMAAVYGPGEVKIMHEIVDKATVDVVYKPRSGLPGCAEKLHERYIRNTVETCIMTSLHPRSYISVILQEMQNSGALLACCVNAACLALLDACMSLKFQVAGVCLAMDSEGNITMDPNLKQEKESAALFTFVIDSRDENVVTIASKGKFTKEQFDKCLLQARIAAKQIFAFYRTAIEKKMSKT